MARSWWSCTALSKRRTLITLLGALSWLGWPLASWWRLVVLGQSLRGLAIFICGACRLSGAYACDLSLAMPKMSYGWRSCWPLIESRTEHEESESRFSTLGNDGRWSPLGVRGASMIANISRTPWHRGLLADWSWTMIGAASRQMASRGRVADARTARVLALVAG
jgi:hypothetical protein